MRFKTHLDEASATQAVDRGNELHKILMDSDALKKLEDAHMKVQKEAAKIFQQAIQLLKGLK
jgi:hypothetical protein